MALAGCWASPNIVGYLHSADNTQTKRESSLSSAKDVEDEARKVPDQVIAIVQPV